MPFRCHEDAVTHVRKLADDEFFVLTEYEDHAINCSRCIDVIDKTQGSLHLCERGLQYASDVANYIFSKGGRAFSVVDKEHNNNVLVCIPRSFKASRCLLLATEYLPLQHKKLNIGYPSTDPVGPLYSTETLPSAIARAPSRRRRVIVYRRTSPSRDYGYEHDCRVRGQNFVSCSGRYYDERNFM